MSQFQALVTNMLEQGLLFSFLGLGVLLTFRFFRFPDLTAEGTYPLGGAVAATLLVNGLNPFLATLIAVLAGAAAGMATAFVHTKLKINNIISGIIVMTALYTVNLRVMGRANVSLLSTSSIVAEVANALQALGIPAREDALTTIGVTAVLIVLVVTLLQGRNLHALVTEAFIAPALIFLLALVDGSTKKVHIFLVIRLGGKLLCLVRRFFSLRPTS